MSALNVNSLSTSTPSSHLRALFTITGVAFPGCLKFLVLGCSDVYLEHWQGLNCTVHRMQQLAGGLLLLLPSATSDATPEVVLCLKIQ